MSESGEDVTGVEFYKDWMERAGVDLNKFQETTTKPALPLHVKGFVISKENSYVTKENSYVGMYSLKFSKRASGELIFQSNEDREAFLELLTLATFAPFSDLNQG